MPKTEYSCKVCGESFASERSLHAHLKKHSLTMADYYTKYYPRNNLLTGDPLPFKTKQDYFSKDFSTRSQLLKWCEQSVDDQVEQYILKLLKNRVEQKDLKFGPGHLELKINSLPTIDIYQKHFGSYTEACEKVGVKPMFSKRLPESFLKEVSSDIEIFVDTREQKPLTFDKSSSLKLEFGDYAVGGEYYNYTYVDRKSEQDFKSTLSKNNLERFREELKRARDFDSYLFVVTESDLSKIAKNNHWGAHRSNLKYIYHNMRVLSHEFAGNCQFIFTGSRAHSQDIIPKILVNGKDVWDVDLQYYIDEEVI